MSLIQNLLHSLRDALSLETQIDSEERYLAAAIDHADLERRMAAQSRSGSGMTLLNIGR